MAKRKPHVLAFIGARGGSKGLPSKNIRLMNGKPLIAYSIEAGKAAKLIDHVVVATDSDEIAKVSKQYGASVIHLPAEYVTDTAPMEPSIKYTLETFEKEKKITVDILVYFQLTDFFKKPEWIDQCIQHLIDNPDVDSCFIGCKEHKNFWRKEGEGYMKLTNPVYGPRQKREPIFREDTGLGAATRAAVVRGGRRLGEKTVLLEKHYPFFDIHTEFDFAMLEAAAKKFPNILEDEYEDFVRPT